MEKDRERIEKEAKRRVFSPDAFRRSSEGTGSKEEMKGTRTPRLLHRFPLFHPPLPSLLFYPLVSLRAEINVSLIASLFTPALLQLSLHYVAHGISLINSRVNEPTHPSCVVNAPFGA